MEQRKLFQSFNTAIEGFIYVLKTQRNMRIHFLLAVLVILVGIYLDFPAMDITALCITVTIVLVAEMINTGLELVVDMVQSEFHPIARIIKDVSAGAVLLTAINAVIVGYLLFSKGIPPHLDDGIMRIRQSPWHLTFMSIIIVLSLSVTGKILFHRGTPLRGGMPSGHAAFAFAAWTVILFMAPNPVVVILSFVLAFMIARYRIKDSVHTLMEVIAGALLGILVTTLIFQLLR